MKNPLFIFTIILSLYGCDNDQKKSDQPACCNESSSTTVQLNNNNWSATSSQLVLSHGTANENESYLVYSVDSWSAGNANDDIWFVLNTPANQYPPLEVTKSVILSDNGNCDSDYLVYNVVLNKNVSPRTTGYLDVIHIPITQAEWNAADYFLLKVGGDDKKVVASKTSTHPKPLCP